MLCSKHRINNCFLCTKEFNTKIHIYREITIPPYIEALIGSSLLVYNIPAFLRIRIFSTVAPVEVHPNILQNGLIPKSHMPSSQIKGLTPPIKKFETDAIRRIYLGGYWSSTVYSNIQAQALKNPNWTSLTKTYKFQCGFLFKPTINYLKYPLFIAVPENLFKGYFMKDEFSIVKIFEKKFFGSLTTVSIPGAYKSVLDYHLLPKYFVGSPHFDFKKLMYEAYKGQIVNPLRFIRGTTFTTAGGILIIDSCKKMIWPEWEE